mmetsp:Transcript_6535/g.18509  ORF Transcript_6535/g.18509 Transcript_6535/m.18509 type:complete len:1170 (-) Transcript_6535:276-3785(-)
MGNEVSKESTPKEGAAGFLGMDDFRMPAKRDGPLYANSGWMPYVSVAGRSYLFPRTSDSTPYSDSAIRRTYISPAKRTRQSVSVSSASQRKQREKLREKEAELQEMQTMLDQANSRCAILQSLADQLTEHHEDSLDKMNELRTQIERLEAARKDVDRDEVTKENEELKRQVKAMRDRLRLVMTNKLAPSEHGGLTSREAAVGRSPAGSSARQRTISYDVRKREAFTRPMKRQSSEKVDRAEVLRARSRTLNAQSMPRFIPPTDQSAENREDLDQLKFQKKLLEDRVKYLAQTNERLEKENASVVQKATEQLQSMEDEIESTQSTLADVKMQLELTEENEKIIAQQNDTLLADVASLKAERESLSERSSQVDTLERERRDAEEQSEKLSTANRELGYELQAAKRQLEAQTEKAESLRTEKEDLEGDRSALRSERDDLTGKIADLENVASQLRAELNSVKKMHADAEEEKAKLDGKMESLEESARNTKEQANALAAENDMLKSKVHVYENSTEKDVEIERLSEKMREADVERKQLEETLAKLQEEVSAAEEEREREAERADGTIADLHASLQELTAEKDKSLKDLLKARSVLEEREAQWKDERAELESKIQSREGELAEANVQLADLRADKKKLTSRVAELEDELDKLRAHLRQQEEEQRLREEQEAARKRMQAQAAQNALDEQLKVFSEDVVKAEAQCEVLRKKRDALWEKLQALLADIRDEEQRGDEYTSDLQTARLQSLEKEAKARSGFSSVFSGIEKRVRACDERTGELKDMRSDLEDWREELGVNVSQLKGELQSWERKGHSTANNGAIGELHIKIKSMEETLDSLAALDSSSMTWSTIEVLRTKLEKFMVAGRQVISGQKFQNDSIKMEELDSQIRQCTEELRQNLEEAEFGMMDIDDLLAEARGLKASKDVYLKEVNRYKQVLGEVPKAEDAQTHADKISQRKNALIQMLKQLKRELDKNAQVRDELQEKVSAEDEALLELSNTLEKFIAGNEQRSKQLDALLALKNKAGSSVALQECVGKADDAEELLRQLSSLLDGEQDALIALQKLREDNGDSDYQAMKGDVIDGMMSELLKKILESDAGVIPSNFKRLSEGIYQFGTRKIHATILAGSLVVRVGGGYMAFTEFVKKYGKFEQVKIIKAQQNQKTTVVKSGSTWKTVSVKK